MTDVWPQLRPQADHNPSVNDISKQQQPRQPTTKPPAPQSILKASDKSDPHDVTHELQVSPSEPVSKKTVPELLSGTLLPGRHSLDTACTAPTSADQTLPSVAQSDPPQTALLPQVSSDMALLVLNQTSSVSTASQPVHTALAEYAVPHLASPAVTSPDATGALQQTAAVTTYSAQIPQHRSASFLHETPLPGPASVPAPPPASCCAVLDESMLTTAAASIPVPASGCLASGLQESGPGIAASADSALCYTTAAAPTGKVAKIAAQNLEAGLQESAPAERATADVQAGSQIQQLPTTARSSVATAAPLTELPGNATSAYDASRNTALLATPAPQVPGIIPRKLSQATVTKTGQVAAEAVKHSSSSAEITVTALQGVFHITSSGNVPTKPTAAASAGALGPVYPVQGRFWCPVPHCAMSHASGCIGYPGWKSLRSHVYKTHGKKVRQGCPGGCAAEHAAAASGPPSSSFGSLTCATASKQCESNPRRAVMQDGQNLPQLSASAKLSGMCSEQETPSNAQRPTSFKQALSSHTGMPNTSSRPGQTSKADKTPATAVGAALNAHSPATVDTHNMPTDSNQAAAIDMFEDADKPCKRLPTLGHTASACTSGKIDKGVTVVPTHKSNTDAKQSSSAKIDRVTLLTAHGKSTDTWQPATVEDLISNDNQGQAEMQYSVTQSDAASASPHVKKVKFSMKLSPCKVSKASVMAFKTAMGGAQQKVTQSATQGCDKPSGNNI